MGPLLGEFRVSGRTLGQARRVRVSRFRFSGLGFRAAVQSLVLRAHVSNKSGIYGTPTYVSLGHAADPRS